ncbi:ATP-binding protein [uncultured Streptomyces sp.]|uniref:ATP-binding protein n=1 Tax=uncultured Streptomyces sp. TaxID=174707 RepID=UPI00261FEFA2|nr:ATP-binding protein [uncultured Streptomyces sp.]
MTTITASATISYSGTVAADAREVTRAFLDRLTTPAVDDDAADTVVLVVSELVTNAVRHGGGTFTLELTECPGGVEVAVHDLSSAMPRMRTPDLNGGAGGFGWPMVHQLARTTSVTPRPGHGKTVRAVLDR